MRKARAPGARSTAVLLWVLVLAGSSTHAQVVQVYFPDSHSFDTVTDPRSVAMGESSVADAGDPAAAFTSNPATLAFLSGRTAYCNYRSFDWFDDDVGYEDLHAWSVGIASSAPMGGMALAFSKRGLATSDSREYDQTFSLAYAVSRGDMAVGGALKFFNRYFHVESLEFDPDLEYGWSYLPSFDLGVLYHARGPAARPHGGLAIGVALQNHASDHVFTATTEEGTSERRTSLPRYLRVGLRYAIDRPSTDLSPPLRFVVTAEYRRFLNPPPGRDSEIDDLLRDADFGGIGFELTLYRWLSLRTGWINGYQDRHRLHNRSGLGINLSPDGELLPGKVSLDYALIRVPEIWIVETTRFVHSFGLRMSW